MSKRPGVICKLVTGKLLSAQKHFVATFNWLVSFADNLKGDKKYINVNRSDTENPFVELDYEKLREDLKNDPHGIKGGVTKLNGKDGVVELVSGSDSVVHFTPRQDGTIEVSVYYS